MCGAPQETPPLTARSGSQAFFAGSAQPGSRPRMRANVVRGERRPAFPGATHFSRIGASREKDEAQRRWQAGLGKLGDCRDR